MFRNENCASPAREGIGEGIGASENPPADAAGPEGADALREETRCLIAAIAAEPVPDRLRALAIALGGALERQRAEDLLRSRQARIPALKICPADTRLGLLNRRSMGRA
ncbi:hypothetical protein XINFAN_01399 [Pseudogemmobacter humi]|uniref:Uncharacterized protein n=2 Tax=Pseudogemmobacter humi TaxID=2483812 RepID=A0A3P5X9N8_9RHOB|nr:hypothetical protein XINFAN_01399 [Pseudogemmobacter humi]